MAQIAGMTVPFLRTNLYSGIIMSPLKHLPYKSNPMSARHNFKSLTLFCYTVVVVKTFACSECKLLDFPSFYFYWFCFFWNFLPPTSPLLVPLGGVSRPVNPGSLLAPLWSFISRASTSLSLSVVTSQSIFSTRLDAAAKSCGARFTPTPKTSTSFSQTVR